MKKQDWRWSTLRRYTSYGFHTETVRDIDSSWLNMIRMVEIVFIIEYSSATWKELAKVAVNGYSQLCFYLRIVTIRELLSDY